MGSDFGLAMSCDIQKSFSYGLINGLVEGRTLERLLDLLHDFSDFTLHPLLVMIVLAEVYCGQLEEHIDWTSDEVNKMEIATGQHSYPGSDNAVDRFKIDFVYLTKTFNSRSADVAVLEAKAEYQQHQLQKIVNYLDEFNALLLDGSRKRRILQMSQSLREHVEYQQSRIENILVWNRQNQRKVQTQLAVVSTLIITFRRNLG